MFGGMPGFFEKTRNGGITIYTVEKPIYEEEYE
jgi:hypothetical protein